MRVGVGSDRVKNPVDDRIEQARVRHHAEVHDGEYEHGRDRRGLLQPATMNFAVSSPKPARSAVVTGTVISATSGDITRLMMTRSRTNTVSKPSSAIIGSSVSSTERRVRGQCHRLRAHSR